MGGVDEYEAKLRELWEKRTQLMQARKKKKSKKRKKGQALRRGNTEGGTSMYETQTCFEDDRTSFMTAAELADNQNFIQEFAEDLVKRVDWKIYAYKCLRWA